MKLFRLTLVTLAAVLVLCPALPGETDSTREPLDARQLIMYTPDSTEVRALRRIYQEAGRVLPVAGFPVSANSLAELAEALGAQTTNEATASSIEEYLRGLAHHPQDLELSIWSRWSLEGYLHAGTPTVDLRHDYLERLPLGELILAWSRPGKAAVLAEGFVRSEYSTEYATWNLPGSTPSSPVALENKQVARGYFWYNFDPLELEFGRDKVHFGPLRSSLLPSSQLPFLDMLRLTLPMGPLTMDLMISTLENRPAEPENLVILGADYDFKKSVILANLHRFEYDFGFLRAAVSALCIYARPNNAFVLADFFPVFSWHSADITPNNLNLVLDLEAVLFPGFRVMAQFGLDDINAGAVGGDSAIPTIPAVIAGLEYVRPLGRADFSLYAETGYTHYLWGNFDDDCYLARAIYRLALDGGTRILPLTSPYGPGAVWAAGEAALEGWRGLSARLFAEFVWSAFDDAAAGLLISYAADDAIGDAPREGRHRVGLELRYRPRNWLQVSAQPVVFFGSRGTWFETSLGLSVLLDRRFPVKQPAAR